MMLMSVAGLGYAECPETLKGIYSQSADARLFVNGVQTSFTREFTRVEYDGKGTATNWGVLTILYDIYKVSGGSTVASVLPQPYPSVRYKFNSKTCVAETETTYANGAVETGQIFVTNQGYTTFAIRVTQNTIQSPSVQVRFSESWKE